MRAIAAKPDLLAQVQQTLIDAIVSGELPAGTRLTQEDLAERLGVSRQPILQSLLLLRDQGLVVDAPNRRGLLVAPFDARFITDLYELRGALDGAAAAAAARHAATLDHERGHKLIRQGRDAFSQANLRQMVQTDYAFHRFIYESSGNALLIDAAERHWNHTRRMMAAHLSKPNHPETVWAEHEAILEAVLTGSARQAEKLSRRHTSVSLKLVLGGYQENADKQASLPA